MGCSCCAQKKQEPGCAHCRWVLGWEAVRSCSMRAEGSQAAHAAGFAVGYSHGWEVVGSRLPTHAKLGGGSWAVPMTRSGSIWAAHTVYAVARGCFMLLMHQGRAWKVSGPQSAAHAS